MKISGFGLQLALKRLTAQRELELARFGETLYQFEGEKKPHPDEVAEKYLQLERKIAKVQSAQAKYNSGIDLGPMSLQEAVKFIGGLTRLERLWKGQVKPKETPRWMGGEGNSKIRDKEKDYAMAVFSTDELMTRAMRTNGQVAELRAAIQRFNANEKTLEELGLSPADLE